MRKVAFPELPIEEVDDRIRLWGPIPRLVLVHVGAEQQAEYWADLKKTDERKIAALVRVMEGSTEVSAEDALIPHRIVIQRCEGQDSSDVSFTEPRYYRQGKLIFASFSVAYWAIKMLKERYAAQVARMLEATSGIPSLGAFRGYTFERVALAILAKGGTFRTMNLYTKAERVIHLPAADAARLVVFPRPWYAGWQATLDGRPLATTAYKNVAIAAAVPPHAAGRLAITYRPAGFTLGLPIALVAALVTLVIVRR
jgi:hypothetical protein